MAEKKFKPNAYLHKWNGLIDIFLVSVDEEVDDGGNPYITITYRQETKEGVQEFTHKMEDNASRITIIAALEDRYESP